MSAARPRAGAVRAGRLRRAACALGPLAAGAVLLACAGTEGSWPALGPEPPARPWVDFENRGPLPVRGAEEDAPGRAIYRYVARRPELAGFLREQGPPATLEVARSGEGPLRVLLRYPERRGGCRIRLQRAPESDERWSASLPDCPSARRSPPPRRAPEPEAEPARTPAPPPPEERCEPPTALQKLECPIDPEREDCAALCRCDGGLEWCD